MKKLRAACLTRGGLCLRAGAVALVVVAVAVGGCGKEESEEAPAEPALDVESPSPGAAVTIDAHGEGGESGRLTITKKGEEGETQLLEYGLPGVPEGFPKDFPVYEGADVTGGRMTGADGEAYMLTLTTEDDVAAVAEYYKKALPEKGYSIKSTMSMPEGQVLMFQKGEDSGGTVTVASGDEGTVAHIQLSVTP